MFLPSAPFRCRSVVTVPAAYLATGASICTVVNAWKADGMSTLVSLSPTSKVGLAGVGGLVEAGHPDLAAQRVHPEVLQRHALVLHPEPAACVGHLELVVRQLGHGGVEIEVDLGRHRDDLQVALAGAPFVQIELVAPHRRDAAQGVVPHR